jgi:cytochrome c-type biogenesis protein
MELIQKMMLDWYLFLSKTSVALSLPFKQAADWVEIPFLSVFLFGLIGSLSPCQLTTNLSASAYVSRSLGGRQLWKETLAYSAGKLLVYFLLGGAMVFFGFRLEQTVIPVAVAARKAVGPLMILIGLGLMGLIRLPGSFGSGPQARLLSVLPRHGAPRAFSLGVVFSFTFCPTLFWLFFGLTIPLALASRGGWSFPGLFALGTLIPLFVLAGLMSVGGGMSSEPLDRLNALRRKINMIAGAVFIVAGVNDTLTYWLI